MSYSKFNLFIRSLLFSLYSIVSMMLYSLLCVVSMFMSLEVRHAIIRGYFRSYMWMLKHLCHIDYQVEGLDNIPANRNGVVLSKHQSTWETFFLPLIFQDPAVIIKRELLWIPFFGWGLAASDPIAINRKNRASAMQQVLEKGKKCLQDGRWVLIFPEGTRVPAGTVGHYRLGGARLAKMAGYPVIPVAHNAGRYWPKRQFIKQPGVIRVVVGPLIETEGRSSEQILELAKNWIETTVARIDGLVDESAR